MTEPAAIPGDAISVAAGRPVTALMYGRPRTGAPLDEKWSSDCRLAKKKELASTPRKDIVAKW